MAVIPRKIATDSCPANIRKRVFHINRTIRKFVD